MVIVFKIFLFKFNLSWIFIDTRVVTGSSNENFVLNGKLNPSTVSITHVRPAIMKDKST